LGKNSQQRGNRERRVAIIGLGTYRRPSGRFKRFSSTEFLVVTTCKLRDFRRERRVPESAQQDVLTTK